MDIQDRIKNHVCCFCGGALEHYEGQDPSIWGNNPDNACSVMDARCCDYCNETIVIPVRLYTSRVIEKALAEKDLAPFDLDEDD